MIFSRKQPASNSHQDGNKKRVVSDMRPRGALLGKPRHMPERAAEERPRRPLPEEHQRITLPHDAEPPVMRRPEKEKQRPPAAVGYEFAREPVYVSPPRRSKISLYVLLVTVLFFAGLGVYIIWASNLTLIVERKKAVFDLGSPGIKITVPAKSFADSFAKRGEEISKSITTFNEKASGTIIVYNAYNSQSQVLVAGTRFATPEGLIFRSTARVVVPGRTSERPGSVEVPVAAHEAGPKYNIGLTDFTIPGFAGGPKFEKFYGRSKTEMKGGAVGKGAVVGKAEADQLLERLEDEMNRELKQKFESSIPKDYVTFPSKFEYTTDARMTDPAINAPAEKFFGEVRGSARTLALDPETYSETLAAVLFKDKYQEGAAALHKSSKITFKNVTFDYNGGTVTAVLEGRAVFEWALDVDDFSKKVLQAPDAESLSEAFFKGFPAISRVEAVFKPQFWKRIPQSEKKLIIELKE